MDVKRVEFGSHGELSDGNFDLKFDVMLAIVVIHGVSGGCLYLPIYFITARA